MTLALDLFTIIAVSLGAIFFLAGTVGLLRFPDTLTRLHALTKADNLGLGLVVLGLAASGESGPWGGIGLIAVWFLALLVGCYGGPALPTRQCDRPGLESQTPDAGV